MFGIGNSGGPSVLHSLSIVSIGMLSANYIDFKDKWKFPRMNLTLLSLLLLGLAIYLMFTPWSEFIENYFSNTFRNNNHPLYFIVSLSLAIILVLIFSVLIPLGAQLKPWTKHLLVFGRNSLSAFTIGNIILNLIYTKTQSNSYSLIAPFGFILFVYILLFLYENYQIRKNEKKLGYVNK
jgi:predicted acyltransferase